MNSTPETQKRAAESFMSLLGDENVVKTGKTPIYAIGRADPITFVNPSAVDVRMLVDGEPFNIAQAISIKARRISTGKLEKEGTLLILGSPASGYAKKILDNTRVRLQVIAADEYGSVENIFDEVVEIQGYDYGVSVDDIVTETTIYFSF